MHAAVYPLNVASRAHTSTRRLRAPRRVSPAARAVRVRASGTSDDASADDALTLQWMALNYRPWIKSEEDARKCLTHLREKENREFDLAKAKDVLDRLSDVEEKLAAKDKDQGPANVVLDSGGPEALENVRKCSKTPQTFENV